MKVSELIEVLKDIPEDMDVYTAYDSYVMIYTLTKKHMLIAEGEKYFPAGLVLFSGGDDYARYMIEDKKLKGKLL